MIEFLLNLPFYVLPYILVVGVVITVHVEFGHFLAAGQGGEHQDRSVLDRLRQAPGSATPDLGRRRVATWASSRSGATVRFAGDENAASMPDQDDLEEMRQDLLARVGPVELRRYYHFKPLWQRAMISAAGPIANFLLAVAIFATLLMTLGQPLAPPRINFVKPGSPAEQAGFKINDIVRKANGQCREDWPTTSSRSSSFGPACRFASRSIAAASLSNLSRRRRADPSPM